MTADFIRRYIVPAAASLLPEPMDSPSAWALVMAIGYQESGFRYRRQMGNGPARGFFQFEMMGGVAGVLEHKASKVLAMSAAMALGYSDITPRTMHAAIEHNDVLAAVFARLLLWTSPKPLPGPTDAAGGWVYYLSTWRPGKPHEGTWAANYAAGWATSLPGDLQV
jgi:hypothetical protein